ncbi:hypothetical protein DFH28DRAFT_929770 [Melampsora americana]|nr:hypothetical protein DFH28DRAFT_929770 [Melampsora americana]
MADGTIVDEDGDLAADQDSDDEEDARTDSGKDVEASDDSEDEDEAPDYREQQPDAALLPRAVTKVRRINKLITSSAGRLNHFKMCASQLGFVGGGLIGAHGQRWNIWFDAQTRLCKAKSVINFMINDDQEGFYEGITISPEEWKAIEALNDVLGVSVFQFYSHNLLF